MTGVMRKHKHVRGRVKQKRTKIMSLLPLLGCVAMKTEMSYGKLVYKTINSLTKMKQN